MSATTGQSQNKEPSITYLNGAQSQQLDDELMGGVVGYTLEQLMELCGLAAAQAIHHFYPPSPPPAAHTSSSQGASSHESTPVFVVAGPGNNGGDGLACARHLALFGYNVTVVYPKEPKSPFNRQQLKQLAALAIPVVSSFPDDVSPGTVIVDAVFGFSFVVKSQEEGIREPYRTVIQRMVSLQSSCPVVSLDVPSGWNVEQGDVSSTGLRPAMLVSLSLPKLCARGFPGHHVLGGRFVPPSLATKLNLCIPPYTGAQQWLDITKMTSSSTS